VKRLTVGDVITFEQPDVPGRKVTHRITKVERGEDGQRAFVTKGDNNDVRDPWRVAYIDEGYRVVAHVERVGWVMLHAQSRWARVLLVVLPIVVLLGQFLRWIWRSDDDEPSATDRFDGEYSMRGMA
jgi:signal peptidase